MHAVVPPDWYNQANGVEYDKSAVNPDLITKAILDAITYCERGKVDALFLPEYFIPRRGQTAVLDAANNSGLLLIGGVEGKLQDQKIVNEVAVWLPDAGASHYQRKQRPSKYEHADGYFLHDTQMKLFTGTVLGNLGVIVCSDFLEADVMSALTVASRDLIHTIVVCARNPNSAAFNTLAEADSIRYYANVLVANSTETEVETGDSFETASGCILALPTRDRPETKTVTLDPIAGARAPTLLIRELHMDKLRARSHRRHEAHWMTPSFFASRV